MYSKKWLPANYWEYAAKHFVRASRFVPTKKTAPFTPSHMIGAGDLDLSVKFLFPFGDFVAVRIPDAGKKWKLDLRRDLGIHLRDADDTKRGSLILNPFNGSVQVRLDCIKHELSDHSYYDSRLRLSDARPPIDFESFPELEDDFGKIWMDSQCKEVLPVKRAARLLQVCLFLKMHKFLKGQKCTLLRKNCTMCHAEALALCLFV